MLIDIQKMIADSPNQTLLTALTEGNLEKALSLATEMMEKDKSAPHAIVAEYFVKMAQDTDSTLLQEQYLEKVKGKDVMMFVVEFSRLLVSLRHPNIDEQLFFTTAKLVKELILDYAKEISVKSGDYPEDIIQAKVWLDGAALREWCQLLADVYQELNLLEYEAPLTFAKTKVTLSIMSHYHHFVGPDMISSAKCYERLEDYEPAKQYYYAVIMDFEWLIEDYQEELIPNEEDYTSLTALAAAYKGYLALCGEEDKKIPNQLATVENILKRKQQA